MKNRIWCSWTSIVPQLCIVLKMVDLATACWGNTAPNLGNLTSDYSIEVGSTVDLNCTLHQHQIFLKSRDHQNETYFVNSTHLEFRFNSTTIPREYVHIVNPLTAQLRIPNASIAYSGKYYCNLKLPEMKKDITVCLSIIFVGYKPRAVDQNKFSCLSKNFENLTCCWIPPYNPVRTTYTLESDVRIGNYLVGSKSCPNNTGVNDTCCQWRLDTNPPYHRTKKELVFKLTGRNHLGNITQNIIVDHYKFVIPNKPWGLQATGETQKSIKLNWLSPKDFDIWNFEPGLVYELRYKSRSNNNQMWKMINVGKGSQTYNLTGLIPNTVYELSVRCRSAKADGEEMWSQPAVIVARTNPDVPYFVPNITKGSFEIKKLSTSRSITLYWKPVPPEHYNGQDFHYVITYKPVFNTIWKREVLEQNVEVTGFKHTFTDMDLNTVYYFKFQSANREGLSSSMVDITVDKTKNLPIAPVEVTAMSYGNGTYQVNWDYPERERSVITRFTIYWCPSLQPHPFLCRHPIKWRIVPASSTYVNIQLSDDINYQFAVSADSTENSSGMKRMSCIVPYEKALDKVQDVYVYKIFQGLQVEWRLACSAQKKVVTQYQVEYCKVKNRLQACINSQSLTTYNQDTTKMNITNLEPFTLYRVTVQVLSKAGISSLSDPKYERTLAGAPSVPQEVKVVDVNSSAIHLTWKTPAKPNGIIMNYVVHYRNFSQEVIASHDKESYSLVLGNNIESYTNYSVAVQACVDKHCSSPSSAVYGMTWIDAPGMMEDPHVEVINSTNVRVRWSPPEHPNGPIDFYLLVMKWQEEANGTQSKFFNISGSKTSIIIPLNCPLKMDSSIVNFTIQAGNIRNNTNLLGPSSSPTRTKMCFPEGLQVPMIVGAVVGGTLGLILLVIVLCALVRWMKKKINLMKQTKVQLPNGLDAPNTEPFIVYGEFKKHIDKKNSTGHLKVPIDSLDLYLSNNNNAFGERQGSEISRFSNSSTDELIQRKIRCTSYGRNPSGDSSGYSSAGGHDSISSSLTAHTQLSSECHAEPELTGSITSDAVFMDCHLGTDNFLAHSQGKVGLPKVEELQDTEESHSGITSEETTNVPSSQPQHPYSCFSIRGQTEDGYISFLGHRNNTPVMTRNLSNSEPSVFDIDDEQTNEVTNPLVAVLPYSRFGLAKSLGSTFDFSILQPEDQIENVTPSTGYSKFGVIHVLGNPLKQTCSLKVDENNVRVGMALITPDPDLEPKQVSLNKMPTKGYVLAKPVPVSDELFTMKSTQNPTQSVLPFREAYSKLGLPTRVPKSRGYISLPNALRMFSTSTESGENQGYSKFGIEPNLDHIDSLGRTRQESQLSYSHTTNPENNVACENTDVTGSDAAFREESEWNKTEERLVDSQGAHGIDKSQSSHYPEELVANYTRPVLYRTISEPSKEKIINTEEEEEESTDVDSYVPMKQSGKKDCGVGNGSYVPQNFPFSLPHEMPQKKSIMFKNKNESNGYVRWNDIIGGSTNFQQSSQTHGDVGKGQEQEPKHCAYTCV
ncbi:uncharacterized protein LOC106469414 [Limulus polyphemus]|uniref:Uncharacterized protein LOC106469414 n=1 Tax=Limulus polyphemus TaxID=6850 RepID=A0ABM1BN53_LIMPO|nr:uncharacterized protein LOC106469414 [Limulus polyphemus]XP_022253638.1 uncharacterized protein LOC106469414 [Limulus polyphemus]